MTTFTDLLIQKMLSGEPFTYGSMIAWRNANDEGAPRADADRLVDRTIQKLRRAGKIDFTREGRAVRWRPTAPADTKDGTT